MELTGKCKVDFEKWFTRNDNHKGFDEHQVALDVKYRLKVFYQLYDSMQYGVYVDFFDSVGVFININTYDYGGRYFQYSVDDLMPDTVFYKRSEAITQSIQKANELYNN